MLGDIVDGLILVSAVCAAIYKIWDFFAKPTSKLKQRALDKEKERIKAVLNEELPVAFLAHDLETREKYKADRQQYLVDIKNEVVTALGGSVSQNASDLEALKISARDVLREKIMQIYRPNKRNRSMTEDEHDALIQYYKDYKALKGNSYIDDRYERMKKWTIIYDDDGDEDN